MSSTARAISHCHFPRTLPTNLNLHQRLHFAMSTKMLTFSVSSACAGSLKFSLFVGFWFDQTSVSSPCTCSFEFALVVALCFDQTQPHPPTCCHPTHLSVFFAQRPESTLRKCRWVIVALSRFVPSLEEVDLLLLLAKTLKRVAFGHSWLDLLSL